MEIQRWCNRIIYVGFVLLFALVPLLLTPWNYELFEYNKMMAVYALTVIITGTWGIKMLKEGRIRIAKTPLDIPILLFVSSQLLSTLFSIDPHVSWFGYYSRFNGGMLSIVCYVVLFYAFVSNLTNLTNLSHLSNLVKGMILSAVLVALYGVAERLGIDKHLWVQDVQNRVFSSLGQPNWLAAYLVTLVPLAMAFLFLSLRAPIRSGRGNPDSKEIASSITPRNDNRNHWSLGSVFWVLITILFFSVLLFTRSRSGLAGFTIADVIFWSFLAISATKRGDWKYPLRLTWNTFWQAAESIIFLPLLLFPNVIRGLKRQNLLLPFIICHVAFGIVIFFNGTYIDTIDRWLTLESWKNRLFQQATTPPPASAEATAGKGGTLLEYGGTESGTIRKNVWEGALNAWRSSQKATLIGTGTETFAFAFFRYKPTEHNLTSEWDFLYNKAHNEYLNYLATTGILGLGSYLLLLATFIIWFIKSQYSIHNIQQGVKNYISSLDIGYWILDIALFAGWLSILVTNFFGFAVVITNLFLFLLPALIIVLTGYSTPATSFVLNIRKSFTKFFSLAIFLALLALLALLSRSWYADTLFAGGYRYSHAGQFTASYPLLTQAIQLNDQEPLYHDEYAAALAGLAAEALESKQASTGAELITLSLKESDRALTASPQNVNFWKTRTKIYYAFANADPQWNKAAIEALTKAAELAPTDPKIFYNLAILYGREGDNKKAIELLQKTIILKQNYRDATYALWVFYTETKQAKQAKEVLETYLKKVDPGDKDFLERIK